MIDNDGNATESVGALIVAGAGMIEVMEAPHFTFAFECFDSQGRLKWREDFRNLVTTGGKNNLLDTYFAGSAYTAAWYLGLVDGGTTPTYAAADTMASHAGWTENQSYSNAARVTLAFAAASAGSKATSTNATFTINATATIAGGFTTTVNTKGGTTGILYSAGSFTGGNRAVVNGDTLNVSGSWSV